LSPVNPEKQAEINVKQHITISMHINK